MGAASAPLRLYVPDGPVPAKPASLYVGIVTSALARSCVVP